MMNKFWVTGIVLLLLTGAQAGSYGYANSQLAAKLERGQLRFYHSDSLGSTRTMTNEQAEAVERQMTLPFGGVLEGGERYGFTGKELDESGLQYFGARYYDSGTGRFISTDPAMQYHSPYIYAGNNPLAYKDSNGRFAQYVAAAPFLATPVGWVAVGGLTLFTLGFMAYQATQDPIGSIEIVPGVEPEPTIFGFPSAPPMPSRFIFSTAPRIGPLPGFSPAPEFGPLPGVSSVPSGTFPTSFIAEDAYGRVAQRIHGVNADGVKHILDMMPDSIIRVYFHGSRTAAGVDENAHGRTLNRKGKTLAQIINDETDLDLAIEIDSTASSYEVDLKLMPMMIKFLTDGVPMNVQAVCALRRDGISVVRSQKGTQTMEEPLTDFIERGGDPIGLERTGQGWRIGYDALWGGN